MTTDPTHGLSVPHADALWDALAAPGPDRPSYTQQHERVCAAVADIISEVTAGQPPADQADLRDRIAEALMQWAEGNNSPKYAAVRRPETVVQNAYSRADAVVAVLPTPTDRAAVLREAADEIAGIDFHPNARARCLEIAAGLACRLRRMADEAPQDPTPTDRAVVLLEAADHLDTRAAEFTAAARRDPLRLIRGANDSRYQTADCWNAAAEELRRLAGEAPQDPTQDGTAEDPQSAELDAVKRCETVLYFLECRAAEGRWESPIVVAEDPDDANRQLAKLRSLMPDAEYRVVRQTTTVVVQPLPEPAAGAQQDEVQP